MAQGFSQHMGVAQRQNLTPYQQQGLKLLFLSNLELAGALADEAAQNPLIDLVTPRHARLKGPGTSAAPTSPPSAMPSMVTPSEGVDPNRFVARPETLVEHIAAQVPLADLDPELMGIAYALISELGEDGWLRTDLDAIAEEVGAPRDAVDATLATLQTFTPAGVFCRTLKECITLQLVDRDRLDPWMAGLLDHLDLVAAQDVEGLADALGAPAEDVEDMIAEIRSLNPRPGSEFGGEPAMAVIPDVIVRRAKDDDGHLSWTLDVNASWLPRIVVREGRFERLAGEMRSAADRRWLDTKMNAARRLTELLERRGRTILEVAAEIVKRQGAFLDEGEQALKPLMLKTIAEELDIHESTVSRVVSNKYMQTPRGVIPFKAFFVQAAPGGDASGMTVDAAKRKIAELIAGETARGEVYSDQTLTEMLNREGSKLARRTVAKYREELGIPSSTARRKTQSGSRGG